MPDKNIISKENMRNILEFLGKDCKLAAPVDTGKVVEFQEISAGDNINGRGHYNYADILMDDRVSYKSIKEFYFPQTEHIMTFENEDVSENITTQGYVIFGARPCDLEALRIMSIVYTTGKYADPFFQRRFDANLLIGIGCQEVKPNCFCREMGINKEFSDFCDILLYDKDDSYSVLFLSEKGKKALEDYSSTYHPKSHSSHPELTSGHSSTPPLSLNPDKDDSFFFDIINWDKVTQNCKGCGICTYICPTCYCFDFKDVTEKNKSKRYKCWDSCMYPKFTLHASGHNPRENRYERYRQRVLHKYKYVPENFDGVVACTGCGRCIRNCPVGINIKSIVEQINKK